MSGVKVTLNECASVEMLSGSGTDVIVLATGASPSEPDISGIQRSNVFYATDILRSPDKCGSTVVIIGGGLIGLETALFLSERGKEVTVLEMLKKVGFDLGPLTRWDIRQRLKKAGVRLEVETQVVSVNEHGVTAIRENEMLGYPADTIVIATGLVPNTLLKDRMPEGVRELYCAGDCESPQKILEAVRDGYRVALSI